MTSFKSSEVLNDSFKTSGSPPSAAEPAAPPVSNAKSRSYPSARTAAPTVGSTDPSVNRAARNAAPNASASSEPTRTWRPACSCSREISESARNRLHARSIAASSSLRAKPPPGAARGR